MGETKFLAKFPSHHFQKPKFEIPKKHAPVQVFTLNLSRPNKHLKNSWDDFSWHHQMRLPLANWSRIYIEKKYYVALEDFDFLIAS